MRLNLYVHRISHNVSPIQLISSINANLSLIASQFDFVH